ncbi:hypothetical protein [Streptomyces sp. NPDC015350]|uniref:hypothetical protein n=1 Tax=Streptomyces sp. NPDC015350 TaxID=3364955 RepID=UPI0036FEBC30
MTRSTRKRTVFFFEIVRASPEESRMAPQPWREFLDGIAARDPWERTVVSGEDKLVGFVDPDTPENHLLVAKTTGEVPHQLNREHGTIGALQLPDGTDVAHVTTLCFLPYGNLVGALYGGMSAPRVSALTKWLNGVGLPCNPVLLKPVIHAGAREALNRIEAISEFTVTLEGAPADTLSNLRANAELGRSLGNLGRRHPDTSITLSLKVPRRGNPLSRLRRNRAATRLRNDVLEFMPDLDEWVDESGVVRSVTGQVAVRDPFRQSLAYEPLDFLSHRITAQVEVPVALTDGRSVDLAFAVRTVFDAARTHEQALNDACR